MIANGGTVKTNGVKTTTKGNVVGAIKSLPSKTKALHVVAVIGLFSILLGYISIAPPVTFPIGRSIVSTLRYGNRLNVGASMSNRTMSES